ncbi:PREDICTED: BRCT domain-containing protein At4g02110 [Nelumbo nucifera]|uniref:BRCT domain-containing protein At4g02110 n=2 Tax=Nelumbo nucifera TaxID=4432 RepID=A0A1U7ZZP7_NELNU|nr:PREDICTED: BRCT domain-containing protein At4g02110 [Nelumbo nucifera]DAD38220.1 TPA_asm: hypothetical protein HUJ06_008861 [Nelumbo nucifera]
MFERGEDSSYDHLTKMFLGVHFILVGFDPTDEAKVRSKLVDGGGVDVGQYSPSCTHVIVDKIVYDDSICVAARNDGKTLVTGLWVDHSFDIGMPMDPSMVLYRPVKDLNGIPGAKALSICLTGYQRQDREDIMKMVGLMGAHFSKPLVANKVTHLICYKFEGEKYELAKKMKKIKLVNHRWLEDCLRAWEILPEGSYNKSGYELEILEAEAKDSEEETEDGIDNKKFEKGNVLGATNSHVAIQKSSEMSVPPEEVSNIQQKTASPPKCVSNVAADVVNKRLITSPMKGSEADKSQGFHDKNRKSLEEFECQSSGAYCRNPVNDEASIPFERTPNPNIGCGESTSIARSTKRSHSDELNLNSLSYSRKTSRRSPVSISMFSKEHLNHVTGSPQLNLQENIISSGIKMLTNGKELYHEERQTGALPQKRKIDVSGTIFTSPKKVIHDLNASTSGSPINAKYKGLESSYLKISAPQMESIPSVSNRTSPVDDNGTLKSVENQPTCLLATKPLNLTESLKCELLISKNMTYDGTESPSGNKADKHTEDKIGEPSLNVLEWSNVPSKSNIERHEIIRMAEPADRGEPQNQQQDGEALSPNTKDLDMDIEKSGTPSNLGINNGMNDEAYSGTCTKKVVRKSLGSRPKLSTAKTRKSSILGKPISPNEAVLCSVQDKEKLEYEKVGAERLKVSGLTFKDKVLEAKENEVLLSANKFERKTENKATEAQVPEDKDRDDLDKTFCAEKPEMVGPTFSVNVAIAEKSNQMQGSKFRTKAKSLYMDDDKVSLGESKDGDELKKESNSKKSKTDELTSKAGVIAVEKTNRGKHPSCTTKKNSISRTNEKGISKDAEGEGFEDNRCDEKTDMPKAKQVCCPARKPKSKTSSERKMEKSTDAEKENKPIDNGGQNSNSLKNGKPTAKSKREPMKNNQMVRATDVDGEQISGCPNFTSREPVWFILSGHHLQKKEFQQVIKRLKGRLCRDSHHWSYQATHFIVPDPVRRTEKFFAAAASGRWILKTDYLTASNQAGKFLVEEPYEWYRNGLSEDGAINLEAPRKWRLLRERTGHGAFHGMQVIIYGECITPPLDTLKRVVKAGGGTILATCPPYTRFLKSEVDFAIVSAGMPHVDSWVQEFLRHEIPCVVADYLVEYVCKPGYSLERHVLYKTHAWAEKSFANLLSRSEEIIDALSPAVEEATDDLTCQVCGSRDRGEVMLICGDESGSMGCGIGTHIDCCNPPLEAVPKEDWFCAKCNENNKNTNPPKKTKKKPSLLR